MADVGRPLPWSLREAIQRLAAQEMSRRAIARELHLHRATVEKYSKKQPPNVYQNGSK